MQNFPSVSSTAFLIADQTRAAMLMCLLGGRALPAGELARVAGVTAQTASSHLAKLLDGGLVSVEIEGRHRYYRLAGSLVAQALEQLAAIRPAAPSRPQVLSPQNRQLRWCRSCYDHLAGQVGVAVARALLDRDYLRVAPDKLYTVTEAGIRWFEQVGVQVEAVQPTRRGLARQCLDCTERMHHLAGPLGVRLMAAWCESDWLRRAGAPRAITVTPKGWSGLDRTLGLTEASIREAP